VTPAPADLGHAATWADTKVNAHLHPFLHGHLPGFLGRQMPVRFLSLSSKC